MIIAFENVFLVVVAFILHFPPFLLSGDVSFDLTISRFISAPDGVAKEVIGVNGQSPGPTIRVCKGDVVTVRVTNGLDRGEATSIHWHGMPQTWNNINDGVSWITQYPIPAGSSYVYRFVAELSGTHWYHSHQRTQLADGLYGPLIVDELPGEQLHSYDGEFTLLVTDNFHFPTPVLYDWYKGLTKQRRLPVPDTVLVNGKGYYPCNYAERKGLACSPEQQQLYGQLRVQPGKTYRIRLVNPSAQTPFRIQIDGHTMRVIETDGIPVGPGKEYDRVHFAEAQRVSVLVKMNYSDGDQFWIRFSQFDSLLSEYRLDLPNFNPFPALFQNLSLAKIALKYDSRASLSCLDGAGLEMALPPYPTSEPKLKIVETTEMELTAAPTEPPIPSHVNESHSFILSDILGMKESGIGFNYRKLDLRGVTEPALLQVGMGKKLPINFIPIYIKGFGPDYVVEIILNNSGANGHSMHLHGHSYWLVGTGQFNAGVFLEDKYRPMLKTKGQTTRRDTAAILDNSWLVFRFVASNPGVWLFHCHIKFHLENGMGLVFVVGEEAIQMNLRG